ncbi:MAG: hypothetical protein IKX42_07175 [Fibrobacter sp.]|nr:hypothetical protein [Fibrobacter sp.]
MKKALLGKKRLAPFFAVSACAILMACSSDDDDFMFSDAVEEKAESNSEIQMVRSYERLPECTGEREGAEFFVKDEREFYTCDGEDWVSDSEEPASSSSRKSSSSSFDDLYEDNLSSFADSIQRVIDSLTALYTSSSSVLIMPMYSSSSSLPTFLFSSSSAMVSSSSMALSSSSYYLGPSTNTHYNKFSWMGVEGAPFIETGLDNGSEAAGYWFVFGDSIDGGLSYIEWPVPLGNEYDAKAMEPVIEVCSGVCGTAHLNAGTLEYKPFVGVAFNIAGMVGAYKEDNLDDADLADASAWGGICIVYSSDLPATIELGFGAYKDKAITYDYPFVTLLKSDTPSERCFEWSAFKQAGWGRGDKITGEEAGAELASIKFKIQAQDGSSGNFNISAIGSYY